MALLHHDGLAASEVVESAVDRRGDQADDGGGEEDAGQGDDEHDEAEAQAFVAGERAGIQRAGQCVPKRLWERRRLTSRPDPRDEDDEGDEQEEGDGDDSQPGQHSPDPP